ncbi:MAG: hypothetical protein L6R48_17300 [Planctomycetes bacterium]|nr:hypothetical protein [Planctomycetota bacterium]
MKKPLTLRALLARLNRALAKEEMVLRACRADSKWHDELGDYYLVNLRSNDISAKRVDPLDLAKEKGVIKPFEKLEE